MIFSFEEKGETDSVFRDFTVKLVQVVVPSGRCKYLYQKRPGCCVTGTEMKSSHDALPQTVHRSKSASTEQGEWSLNT